ncbi:MAG: 3-hydroxyacyl-CoA dehydrogenase family protein [Dehalococcoidia bacterium]|nr:3-hydroxyacyl-CoA dehydrogenase family protein [Dehalococcoidia bacterium]
MNPEDVRTVGIVGAGLMGHSIAQEFAVAGCQVALNDVSEERLGHARERIRQNLEMLGRSQEVDEVESRMKFTGDLRTAVEDADLVVEAITEDIEIKRALFAELESICREDTILASNTSTFMPSQLAEATKTPGRVVVTHYFNPPHVVPLVEVVGGRDTSPETIETVRDLLLSQGKKPVVLGTEALGFIANRLQAALLRECFALVENGVARPEDIDTVVTTSLGRRLGVAGPFEVFDAAGADVWHAIFEGLAHDIESSTEVPLGIARMVERGDFGLKTGRGVYEWTPESSAELRSRIARAVEEIGRWNDGE